MGQGTNQAWPSLTRGFLSVMVGDMLRQGFTADEIGEIGGGNDGRVFDKVTRRPRRSGIERRPKVIKSSYAGHSRSIYAGYR